MEQRSDLTFVGGARPTGLPNAVAGTDAVPLSQVLVLLENLPWKDDCRAGSSANLNISAPGASIGGVTMVANDRFLARGQTAQPEAGIYIFNGAAVAATRSPDCSSFDELEGAVVSVTEGTDAGTRWRQTQVNGVIGTNNVIWVTDGTSAPAASEATAGIAELATQGETDAGSDDLRMVTPLKLANWPGRKRKTVGAAFGNGSATQFDFTHNFATNDADLVVYRNSGARDKINVDVSRPDANTLRVNVVGAPTTNELIAYATA